MRHKIINVLVILLVSSNLCAQKSNKKMIYKNNEIQIAFQGEYKVENDKKYQKTRYFSKSTEYIQFCKQEPQLEYVQQVFSQSGFLCSMYILPLIDLEELKKEIKIAFEPKKALASLSDIEEISLNGHSIIKWRYRIGKTRLDHYMLKTKGNYYLFISSPYGSNGYIEGIIENVKLLNYE